MVYIWVRVTMFHPLNLCILTEQPRSGKVLLTLLQYYHSDNQASCTYRYLQTYCFEEYSNYQGLSS